MMEIEEKKVKQNALFGPYPNAQQRAEALEYIKKCSSTNFANCDKEKLLESMGFLAAISVKSYGEDKSVLDAAISVLKSNTKFEDVQVIQQAFTIFAISASHDNNTPLETRKAIKATINKNLSAMTQPFFKKIEKYCSSRSNDRKGMINFIDFHDAAADFLGFGSKDVFCKALDKVCESTVTEDVVPLFERLLRVCTLAQNKDKLKPETIQKVMGIVFNSDLCGNMEVLGSGLVFAAKTDNQACVDIAKMTECCKKQLKTRNQRFPRHFFEDIFYFVRNISGNDPAKENLKLKEFVNMMAQEFVYSLDSVIFYEDVKSVFTSIRKYPDVSSIVPPFRNLVNLEERPFAKNEDLTDSEREEALFSRLTAVATFLNQLFPAENIINTLFSDETLLKSIIDAFCTGISQLRSQEHFLSVVNSFSAAFELIYIMRPNTKAEIFSLWKQLVNTLPPEVADLENFTNNVEVKSLVQNNGVLNSLYIIYSTFMVSWAMIPGKDGVKVPVTDNDWIQCLCYSAFFCDSMESSIFIRTILFDKEIRQSIKEDIIFAGDLYVVTNSSDMQFISRYFGILNTMGKAETNKIYENSFASMNVVGAFKNVLDTYVLKNDDGDVDVAGNKERDTAAINLSNLIFSNDTLRLNFKDVGMKLLEETPEKLFVMPASVCNNLLSILGKEADDYIAEDERKKKKAEEEENKKSKKDGSGEDGEEDDEDEIKDYVLDESAFVILEETMGMDKYQVQAAANLTRKSSINDLAELYFENIERINAEADRRRVMDKIKQEQEQERIAAEEEEARKKKEAEEAAEEAKKKAKEGEDDDVEMEEVFEFPRHITIAFSLVKSLQEYSAEFTENKDSATTLLPGIVSKYLLLNKENFLTTFRYLTTKFDPEFQIPFTVDVFSRSLTEFLTSKDDMGVTKEEREFIVTSTLEKLKKTFDDKMKTFAPIPTSTDDDDDITTTTTTTTTDFSVESFADFFKSFCGLFTTPISSIDTDDVETLIANFREDIYSLKPVSRLMEEEKIAEMSITVLNIIANHWSSFVAARKGVFEDILRGLSQCIIIAQNTPAFAKADPAPILTIISNAGKENLPRACVTELFRIIRGFASQITDSVAIMTFRIYEGYAQFGRLTDVFNACLAEELLTEDVRAFLIAGGLILDVGRNGEGFILREGLGQSNSLKSETLEKLSKAGEAQRKALLDGIVKLCDAGNEMAQAVGGYLWTSLPTVIRDERFAKYVAKFVSGEHADLVGVTESLILKTNIEKFFTAITNSDTKTDLESFIEFLMQKIIKTIRVKVERDAFMEAFLKFNEATDILNNLTSLQNPEAWTFVRVILNMFYKKSESVLSLIPAVVKKPVSSDDDEGDNEEDGEMAMPKDISNMTEEEQIQLAMQNSITGESVAPKRAPKTTEQEIRDDEESTEIASRICMFFSDKDPSQGNKIMAAAVNAVQKRFDEKEKSLYLCFAKKSPEVISLQKYKSTPSLVVRYINFTAKLLYMTITNNLFSSNLAAPKSEENGDDETKKVQMMMYEEEAAAVKANYASFIAELPPSMRAEIEQGLEEELRNLRRKYNIKDESGGGGENRNSYEAVYNKAMEVHRSIGRGNYRNNSLDAFQRNQTPSESETPVLTPKQIADCVDMLTKLEKKEMKKLAEVIFPCLTLLALCKPTREELYDKLVALFVYLSGKSISASIRMMKNVFTPIILSSNSKAYGAEVILLNGARVKALIESFAKLLGKPKIISVSDEKCAFSFIAKLTEKIVPEAQDKALATHGKDAVECMEISKEALDRIIDCNVVETREVEDVELKLAGNKANMLVLHRKIRERLAGLIKEQKAELDKIAGLIANKTITGTGGAKELEGLKKSEVLESQLKLFCRITSASMRGENLNKNRSSYYLGNYVIHCNFDDLGLDELCGSVEKVLEAIEEACPELAPGKKKLGDDDDIVIDDGKKPAAPAAPAAPVADAGNPYAPILDVLRRQEELIAQHRRQLLGGQEQDQEQEQEQEPLLPPPPPRQYIGDLFSSIQPPPQPPVGGLFGQPVGGSIFDQPQLQQPPPPPQQLQPQPQQPQQLQQQQPPQPPVGGLFSQPVGGLYDPQFQQFVASIYRNQQVQQPPQQAQEPVRPPAPSPINPQQMLYGARPPQQQINPQPRVHQQPPPFGGPSYTLHPPPPQPSFGFGQRIRPRTYIMSRFEEDTRRIREMLNGVDDVEEASVLLERLFRSHQHLLMGSLSQFGDNSADAVLELLTFLSGVVDVMKFVCNFNGDRDALFGNTVSGYNNINRTFSELTRIALMRAKREHRTIIQEQRNLADELSMAVRARAANLGIELNEYRPRDLDRFVFVKRQPFTDVIIALASFLNIVYITETSNNRIEYEKRHENEAEESNLLHMSRSSSSLTDEGQSLFKEHEKLFSLVLRGDLNLMSGQLKSLVTNVPSLVSFEDKERWFRAEVDKLRNRLPSGSLRVTVDRMNLFEDSFRQMNGSIEELRGRLRVDFKGEGGVDAGGLAREWFEVIAQEIANPQYGLFKPSDDSAIQPNPKASFVNEGAIDYFKFVGRIVGKALWDRQLLDVHFTRSFYKQILGRDVNAKDMESVDREIYSSLRLIYENHIEEDDCLYFSETVSQFGKTEEVPFIPGGEDIPVTDSNKASFINLKVQFLLVNSIKEYLAAFMRGFNEFIPQELIAPFTENQLELLISGMPTVDLQDMRKHTRYSGYESTSDQIVWFWQVVNGFNEEEKAMLLQFITGSSKVPTGGFATILIKIVRDRYTTKLPVAHTCFNQLDLPSYDSFEELKSKLTTAVMYGCVGFGFS